MSKGKRPTIQRMPCYVEGDWESVVDYFQKILRKDRQSARDIANVEKARALNHAKGARIQLFDMDLVKVWKGRETMPCWAKYGLSDPHSDPNNLRNTLNREIGVGVHMSPTNLKALFKRLYADEADKNQRIARDKRHPIISRYKTAGVTTWCLTKTDPPTISSVMDLQTRTAHFLKLYGRQIVGLKHNPETAEFEVLHKILEVNHVDCEDGERAVEFAEKEFAAMRNTRPREGTKRRGLGVLWYDGGKGGSKLWYDAVSAEPVIAKKLGVVIRDREAEEADENAKRAERLVTELAAAEAKAQKAEDERKRLEAYNTDQNWLDNLCMKCWYAFEYMPPLADLPSVAQWIQENVSMRLTPDVELRPRDNDQAWRIANKAIEESLIVFDDEYGFIGPKELKDLELTLKAA
jgi:hypothetical protein